MPEHQLHFPGFGPKDELDLLFFGLLLEKPEAAKILELAERLCREWQLPRHRLIQPNRLHISLHSVGQYDGLPKSVVQQALAAGSGVSTEPFEVRFVRAMSFWRKRSSYAFVLCAVRDAAFIRLHRAIGDAMQRAGIRKVKSQFVPHMTLLYDRRLVAEQEIEPVCIGARSLVLIHSLQGRKIYRHLARWPLQASHL